MVLVIGTENCSRCNMVKNILTNKKVDYQYILINDLPELEQDKYLTTARENNQMSYPMIFKDGEITTLQKLQ